MYTWLMPGEAGVKRIKTHKPKPFTHIAYDHISQGFLLFCVWNHTCERFFHTFHSVLLDLFFLPLAELQSDWASRLRHALAIAPWFIHQPASVCTAPPTSHTLHSARCPQGLARTHKRKWTNTAKHLSPPPLWAAEHRSRHRCSRLGLFAFH